MFRKPHFKLYQQRDAMQCGASCLAMACSYFGYEVSLDKLSDMCGYGKQGISMLSLSKVANKIGMDAVACILSLDKLINLNHPCIVHWNNNHFVFLHKINTEYAFIADPGMGFIKYPISDFMKHWAYTELNGKKAGSILCIRPNNNITLEDINVEAKTSLHIVKNHLRHYHRYLALIIAGLALGSLLQLIMPFLTKSIVDIGINFKDVSFIWLVLFGELFIIVGKAATDFIRHQLLLHISVRVNISIVNDFFIKLLKLPMSFFDARLTGDILQRISDHSRVQSFLTGQTLNTLFSAISFIIYGIVLLYFNSLIFSVFIAASFLSAIWITIFLEKRKHLDYELFDAQAKNQSKTFQFVSSMQEIKLQGCENRRRNEWTSIQTALYKIRLKVLKLKQTQEAGTIFINEIKNILITVMSATYVIRGDMTLGDMLAIQYMVGQLNSPVSQFISFVYSAQDLKLSLERINEIHTRMDEDDGNSDRKSFNGSKSLKIENVSFKYDPHSLKETLTNVSFEIPEGKITAIVGASGSGKSTLIKLMLGYYSVNSGMITIAGNNISEYNMKWWRSNCGVVMQDGVIFSETIARNIAVDDAEIDVARLQEAAIIANIHDYVMDLPLKYNTLIGMDGVGLSQGQKQRILIARAVYKNPDFIFLDEATNSLDALNERMIVQNLKEFYKGRTVVIVAHRLSTVKNADQIIVLDQGQVTERGRHNYLIESKGAYYNLVKNQLELGN